MPEDAPRVQARRHAGYGAEVVTFDRYAAGPRGARRGELAAERGLTLVPPYDDPLVMAGQGTAALELIEDVPDLDVLVCRSAAAG